MKRLEDVIQKKRSRKIKPTHIMVRFDAKARELHEHVVKRSKELGVSMNAYMVALVQLDKENQNE
jgi:thymidylate synthase